MATETRRVVRLVKRGQHDVQAQSPPEPSPASFERRTNRALSATVGSWVEEFRRRRQAETAALLQLRLLAGVNTPEL